MIAHLNRYYISVIALYYYCINTSTIYRLCRMYGQEGQSSRNCMQHIPSTELYWATAPQTKEKRKKHVIWKSSLFLSHWNASGQTPLDKENPAQTQNAVELLHDQDFIYGSKKAVQTYLALCGQKYGPSEFLNQPKNIIWAQFHLKYQRPD